MNWRFGRVLIGLWLVGTAFASEVAGSPGSQPVLHFLGSSEQSRSLTLSAIRDACGVQAIEVDDPYHERRMRYFALPLRCVLDLGFQNSGGAEGQRAQGLLLRALDGYTRSVSGRDLLEPGAFLAFGEPSLMPNEEALPR